MTDSVLAEFEGSGSLPDAPQTMPAAELLSLRIRPGDYVAIMAYAHQAPELDAAVDDLRRAHDDPVSAWRRPWATVPRFLHSTGQPPQGRAAFGTVPAARRGRWRRRRDSGSAVLLRRPRRPPRPWATSVRSKPRAAGCRGWTLTKGVPQRSSPSPVRLPPTPSQEVRVG